MAPNIAQTLHRRLLAMAAVGVFIALAPALVHAQWLKHKTPGIPRTADGKPDLSAPAPRMPDGKPDLSGLWRIDPAGTGETGKAEDTVKPLAWAAALTEKRKENIGRDNPSVLCLPPGPVVDMDVGKIVQTPKPTETLGSVSWRLRASTKAMRTSHLRSYHRLRRPS